MPLETIPWDPLAHLDTPEDQIAYIEAVFEDGDPELIAHAIGDVARVRGMSKIAEEAGLTRAALYKSFRKGGNPTLASIAGVLKALGLKLSIAAA